MYPHLTNTYGLWEIVHLDKWTPTKDEYLPLRYSSLQALDAMIARHLEGTNIAPQKECTLFGKNQHAFRSPYKPAPNVKPMYYIHYAKAILSVRLAFSYHNWYDCLPVGTTLTRVCKSQGCYNPDHFVFGGKSRQSMVD